MQVLVAAASKHGATSEIADRIGERMIAAGLDAVVVAVDKAIDPAEYGAVVIGSGVYAGHWLKSARRFVERHGDALADLPVWLFSSGPIGDPPKPEGDKAVDVADFVSKTSAEEHMIFSGALDKDKLNLGERAIVAAVRSPEGDYRDWEAIDAWVDGIADRLQSVG